MINSRRYLKNKRLQRKNRSKKSEKKTHYSQSGHGPFSYDSLLTPVQSGGVAVPAPAPARSPAVAPYPFQSTTASSLAGSLRSFGDALFSLTQATATGIDAASNAQLAATSQMAAARAIDQAARTVYANLAGDSGSGTVGLYNTLLSPMVYSPPPLPPAPVSR